MMKTITNSIIEMWNFGLPFKIGMIFISLIVFSLSFTITDYVLGSTEVVYVKVIDKHYIPATLYNSMNTEGEMAIHSSQDQYIIFGRTDYTNEVLKLKVNQTDFFSVDVHDRYRHTYKVGRFSNYNYY